MLLSRLAPFVSIVVGSHVLGASQYGYYALVVLIGEFSEMASANWLRIAFTRFGKREGGLSKEFVKQVRCIYLICTVVAIVLSLFACKYVAREQFPSIAFATLFYIAAISTFRFFVTVMQTADRQGVAAAAEIARAVLGLLAGITTMAVTREAWTASVAVSMMTLSVGLVVSRGANSVANSDERSPVPVSEIMQFAPPLIILAFLSYSITSLDKALLKHFYNSENLGVYAAVFAVGKSGFDIIGSSLNAGGFVRMASLYNNGDSKGCEAYLSRQLSFLVSVMLPAAAGLIVIRNALARIIFPPNYVEAFDIAIPYIALGAISLSIKNFVYDNVFHLSIKNALQIPTLFIGAIVSVFIGLLVLPINPFLGASLAFFLGSTAAMISSAVISRRMMRVDMNWSEIKSSLAIGLLVLAAGQLIVSMDEIGNNAVAVFAIISIAALFGMFASFLLFYSRVMKRDVVAFTFISPQPDRVTGLSSYTESLVLAAANLNKDKKIYLVTNSSQNVFKKFSYVENVNIIELKNVTFIPYKIYVLLSHIIASGICVSIGAPANICTTPIGSLVPLVRQYVTVHDTYDVDRSLKSWSHVAYTRILWSIVMRVSVSVVCVSDSTARDLVQLFSWAERKVHVIKEASKYPPTMSRRAPEQGHQQYFLFVANIEKNKNVECLLDAILELSSIGVKVRVFWVGRDVSGIVSKWEVARSRAAPFERLGNVSDDELSVLYQGATALVVSSTREGFCLPVLEAHAFGTPVIASSIPVLREVAGAGAIFFSAGQQADLAAKMRLLWDDPLLRERLSIAAHENAMAFSWERAAYDWIALVEL